MTALIKNETGCNNDKSKFNIFFVSIFLFVILCSFSPNPEGKNWVIVIDAGHGGKDPGAVGATSVEKKITLAVALKTGEYIEKNLKNVKVVYTRKTDVFVELSDRAAIANKNNADLFISIHVNAVDLKNKNTAESNKKVHGAETFVMGLAKDKANLEVAMRENEAILLENDYSTKYEDFDPKSPESYVMFSLMQNIYQQQSINLASKMQTQYKDRVGRSDRGVKQAGFLVLYMTTMPSILTELGFITNAAEEKYLNSAEGQDYLASALFRACREYINELDNRSRISSAAVTNEAPPAPTNTTTDSPASNEVTFMIQISSSVSKIEIKPSNFKGLENLSEIAENNRFKYASGKFTDYSEAVEYRKKIEKVYPDAFIIAVQENKTIPLQQAIEQTKKKF